MTADVLKGRCGCETCEWSEEEDGWVCGGTAMSEGYYQTEGFCFDCGWKLEYEGRAYRMLDATVKELRDSITALNQYAVKCLADDDKMGHDEAVGGAHELRQLLPKEGFKK